MDHIALPSDDLEHAPIEVPVLSDKGFSYDDQGMLTYPARVGVDTALLAADKEPRLPLLDAASFIQAWLWCGLLQEGLRVGFRPTTAPKHVSSDLFVKRIDGMPFISLKRFRETISRTCNSARPPLADSWHHERLVSCIEAALHFVEEATHNPESDKQMKLFMYDESGHMPLTAMVILSIQSLCQSLLDVLNIRIYDDSKSSIPHRLFRQPTKIVDILLQQSGWEIGDIAQLPKDILHRYYLSFYPRQDIRFVRPRAIQTNIATRNLPRASHSDDSTTIEPCHTHAGCKCESISPPREEIEDAFSNNRIVLVRFVQETATIRVETRSMESVAATLKADSVESEGEVPLFLAISHVRSAGLGRDIGYSLPFCQLAFLQYLTETECTSMERRKPYFWIDSMCLPEDRCKRKVAVESIWQVFRAANAVLVLDPPLYRHVISSSEEAVLRIRHSPWKSRLWTLEEGFFARRLLFRLANRTWALDNILEDLEASFAASVPRVVQIVRPCSSPPTTQDEEDLRRSILKLGNDIRLLMRADRNNNHQTSAILDSEADNDMETAKESMQQILRLAYLTSNKFRYFLDETERRLLPSLRAELIKVYTSVEHLACLDGANSTERVERGAKLRIQQLSKFLFMQLRIDEASVSEAQNAGV